MQIVVSKLTPLVLVLMLCFPASSDACTGFYLQAKDGGVAYARTNEFTTNLQPNIAIIPRGQPYAGTMPDGKNNGMKWKNKYGMIGVTDFGLPQIHDGFNEKGLQAGVFFFPGFAEYAKYERKHRDVSLAPYQLATWILSNFANVAEVKKEIIKREIRVVPTPMKGMGSTPVPLHLFVVDAKGNSIVIEPVGGKLVIHDNPVHAITNAPTFDWHLTNLRQYIHLSTRETQDTKLGSATLSRLGAGSGMIGLPGDITPPSRFIRAAYYANLIPQQKKVEQSLKTAIRLLSSFFITKGMVTEDVTPSEEYVQWQVFFDLKNKRFYFNTYDNLNIRMVDMNKLNLRSGKIRMLPMDQKEEFIDLTKKTVEVK